MEKIEIQSFLEDSISEILTKLKIDAVITIEAVKSEERNYFDVNLEVEDGSPELIGRYGSMLESLATILNAMLSGKGGTAIEDQWRVILDVNNYRQERTDYVEELTEKAIGQVKAEGGSVSLNPMKPWERRVVHMVVAKHPEVVTESRGEGMDRYVVISPAN